MSAASNGRESAVRGGPWQGATAAIYVILFALITLAGAACSEPSVGPSSPTPKPAPPPPPPPASLTIEDVSFVVQEGPCSYFYSEPHRCFRARFTVRETGGASAATIQDAFLDGPDGAEPGFINGTGCPYRKPIRVPPGTTTDIFQRDAANPGPDGFCNIWYDLLNTAERRLELLIAFTDDAGARRTFRTTVDVP